MNRTLRNSMSSLPYLTSTALIHPREGFLREDLFLCSSRPPASLLRKWRSWFAVSKDLYVTGSPASAAVCACTARAEHPIHTGRGETPHPSLKGTMQVEKGKTAHLLLFWSISNNRLSLCKHPKARRQRNYTSGPFVWTADSNNMEKEWEKKTRGRNKEQL